MTDYTRSEDIPHNEMTRLTDVMLAALEADPGYVKGMRSIVFLNHDEGKLGAIAIHGYEAMSDVDSLTDVLIHLKTVLNANGLDLVVMELADG